MSDKAVTRVTDPEYTVEFDGKETYVMRQRIGFEADDDLIRNNRYL